MAEADPRFSRNYSSLLASLGFVALLSLAQSDAALAAATAPSLGNAQSFAVLGGQSVTNTGNTVIKGNLGVSPGNTVTGFPPGVLTPPSTIHAGDTLAGNAQTDVTTAYNVLAGEACDATVSADLGGQTLSPGVYCSASSMGLTGTTPLTLNGGPSAVWVFKIGSTLTTGPGSSVVVTGGATKCNVFWQVGSSATLDTTTTFVGNILALTSISMNNAASIAGRALARNGSVTLINNAIDPTGCAGVPASGGVGLSKVFNPSTINAGAVSTLAITLTNASGSLATLSAPLTDTLPAGVVIAPTPNASTTCGGGVVSATAGGNTVSLSTNSTIPVGTPGTCTVSVNVTAVGVGSFLNTLPVNALQTNQGNSLAGPSVLLNAVAATAIIATPTLSEWAMIILAALLAIAGFAAIRRRAR